MEDIIGASVSEIASQLQEEPENIRVRSDLTHVLEKMENGVIAALHITRPRFTACIAPKRGASGFGLEKLGIVNSTQANQVIMNYFQLGRHSLIPASLDNEIRTIENNARACLKRYAIETHWGLFIPVNNYQSWKEENQRYEELFWEKQAYVSDHYDEIVEEVIEAYRILAQDAWAQLTFGNSYHDSLEPIQNRLLTVQDQLKNETEKNRFIFEYVEYIRSLLPTLEDIQNAFSYTVDLGYIPLPSLLAQDLSQASSTIRAKILEEAEIQAERNLIAEQNRLEMEDLRQRRELASTEARAEYQEILQKDRVIRETADLQIQTARIEAQAKHDLIEAKRKMDYEVLQNAQQTQVQLINEFHSSVVSQISEMINTTCQSILASMEKHNGKLYGRVSHQLFTLVDTIKNFNFIEDQQIADQIQRLEASLPTPKEREQASRGVKRIDTDGLRKTLQAVQKEAEGIILEINITPTQRSARRQEEAPETIAFLDEPRKKRRIPEVEVQPEPEPVRQPKEIRVDEYRHSWYGVENN